MNTTLVLEATAMRTGTRSSTVVLLAVSERDAAAEIARHRGLRTARVEHPTSPALAGLRITAAYATAAARSHPAYPQAQQALRDGVARSRELLPRERVA